MKPGFLLSLCASVLLLTLAGCTSYGPATIATAPKGAVLRTQQQVADDEITTMGNLESLIHGIKDAAGATDARHRATEILDRMKTLVTEEAMAEQNATPEKKQQFTIDNKQKMLKAQQSLTSAADGLKKIPGIPPDIIKSFVDDARSIRTASKVSTARTQQQVLDEIAAAFRDLENVIRGVNSPDVAKSTAPKVAETYDRLKNLYVEERAARRKSTPDENAQFDAQSGPQIEQAESSVTDALADLTNKVPVTPPEFVKALDDGKRDLQEAQEAAKNEPSAAAAASLPSYPPEGSGWAIWLLCLIIVGACVAFLFRDGLWSNAICLVNVILAGLLAMNFYEPLANWLTNFNADLHSYVVFFDFLAMWICFILSAVVFRVCTDSVSRVRVRFLKVVDVWGGVVMSLCIGWVMLGFTLTSLHAGPLDQYPFFGTFQPQNNMFLGMLAPDREWLGFTKYQSSGAFCRAVDQDCSFPTNFIEKQLDRRVHVEKYVTGNADHTMRIRH